VPLDGHQRVFRYSPARALCAVAAAVGAIAGLAAFAWQRRSWLALYIAVVLLLILVITRRLALARMRPTNWLVQMDDDRLFIQFRSYLNHHFPVGDPTVLVLPYGEIRSARAVRRSRRIPDGTRSGSETRVQRLAELELREDTTPLAGALAAERQKTAPGAATWRHYPVRLASPTQLEIDWGVVPGVDAFMDLLGDHVEVATPARVSQDDVALQGLDRKEIERRLRDLAQGGEIMAAISVARRFHPMSLTEAKRYVEGLAAEATAAGGDRAPDGSPKG